MSRMSITYQCWETRNAPTLGYKLPHGHSSDGSALRRHSNPTHETSFPHFAMYLQPQSDLKVQKEVSAVATVRFSSSPHTQQPSSRSGASSPMALTFVSEQACFDASPKQPAVSETHVTSSSVTTETEEKVCKSDGPVTSGEAQSRRLRGISATMVGGALPSQLDGTTLLVDRGLRVNIPSSKPGVVGLVQPLNGCGLHDNAVPENSSESSSSICQASEDSSSCTSEGTGSGGDMEAQSAYRGPLHTAMSALDESLPIKRPGLSKFFGGKSRSFSFLADVSSVTELAKPNNPFAYVKRRKMGFNCPLDRHRSYPPPTRSSGASIVKKLPSSGSRSSLAVAVILEQQEQEEQQEQQEQSVAAPSSLQSSETRTFPSRSFSLTDLHQGGSPPQLRRAFVRP